LYGCPASAEKEVVSRLELTDPWATRHPLILPGIFAELERGRHLKLVKRNIDDLEGEIFQLDFQPSLKEKIRTRDANTRNAEKKNAWMDTTYLRNGLISWKTQLAKMADHCDELCERLYTDEYAAQIERSQVRLEALDVDESADMPAGRRGYPSELEKMKNTTSLVKDRLQGIIDEYDDQIRETSVRVDGMTMATQWVSQYIPASINCFSLLCSSNIRRSTVPRPNECRDCAGDDTGFEIHEVNCPGHHGVSSWNLPRGKICRGGLSMAED
jgi:hypothetical protein